MDATPLITPKKRSKNVKFNYHITKKWELTSEMVQNHYEEIKYLISVRNTKTTAFSYTLKIIIIQFQNTERGLGGFKEKKKEI